jgi:hypothetical protein
MGTGKISIIQHNVARSIANMHTCLEIGKQNDVDFICIQEPYMSRDNQITVSHPAYQVIIPTAEHRARVLIYAQKTAKYQYCNRTDICNDGDMLVVDISYAEKHVLQLVNIYNARSLAEGSNEWTSQRLLPNWTPPDKAVVCGDFNAHHPWWNSKYSASSDRTDQLVDWLEQVKFVLVNEPDIPTFFRPNTTNNSVIDLAFATEGLHRENLITWKIDEEWQTGSDHELILLAILEESDTALNPLMYTPFNLEKADWSEFDNHLRKKSAEKQFHL